MIKVAMAPKRNRRPKPGRVVMLLIVSQAPLFRLNLHNACARICLYPIGLVYDPPKRYIRARLRVSGFSLESSGCNSVAPRCTNCTVRKHFLFDAGSILPIYPRAPLATAYTSLVTLCETRTGVRSVVHEAIGNCPQAWMQCRRAARHGNYRRRWN